MKNKRMQQILSYIMLLSLLLGFPTQISASSISQPFGTNGYPEFPDVEQQYYIIYDEGYRNDRLEMVVFDSKANDSYIVWDNSLKLNDNSNYMNDCKYYYDSATHSWVEFETGYGKISDNASNVYASNLDVWKNETLYYNAIPYGNDNNSFKMDVDIIDSTMDAKYLHIKAIDNRTLTIKLSGISVEDQYTNNLSITEKNAAEYNWGVELYMDNEAYSVGTSTWAFDPGANDIRLTSDMQHSVWRYDGDSWNNIGEAEMSYTSNSITWSFSVPEEYVFDFKTLKRFVASVSGTQQERVLRTYNVNKYIYNQTEMKDDIVFDIEQIATISNETEAKNVIEEIVVSLKEDQKTSSTGIDQMTVLAEEAVSNASTKYIYEDVIHITEPLVKELEVSATTTAQTLEEALNNNGVKTQRRISKTVKVSTPNSGVVKVKKDTADTTVDTVKIQTSFASVSMDAMDSAEFSLEERGTNKVAVTFDTDKTTTMKISFPGVTGDTTYMAVVDDTGTAIGGKYNPATGELEAKINESGVYSVEYNEKYFTDIKDKTAEMQDAIKVLAAKGVINGTSETTFSPDDSISRAEIAALIMRTLSRLDPNEDGGFADVTKDNWFFGVAGSSRKHGIINGFEDNTFRGNDIILKEQIVVVAARVLKNEMDYIVPTSPEEYLKYTDADSLPEWAKEDIALAEMANLIMERTDNMFVPEDEMTRGDAAIILMRLFNKIW